MSALTTGDVVRLKSGGPRMTVQHNGDERPVIMANRGECLCQWFDDKNVFHREIFPTNGLVRVEEKD